MLIYSWNMLFRNEKLDDAFHFIKDAEFDIFCLQEVPPEFINRLKTLPYAISCVEELQLISSKRSFPIYSVILTPHEIVLEKKVPIPDTVDFFRTRVVGAILSLLDTEKIQDRHSHASQFADILIKGEKFRVLNLHLVLSCQRERMMEIKTMFQNIEKDQKTIVCGDFNILETFRISLLNYLLGGDIQEWFLYKRERKNMQKLFAENGLRNPLAGKSTHPISSSQLDHILVPQEYAVVSAEVFKNRHGSDHSPVMVGINKF
jgi:endonuclease/exonuclease/phosphatase family metal-dependent hydrolase